MANYSLREVFKQFGKKIFGSCVNSCVSESQNLPLAASQGKVLQDQITQLNSNMIKYDCMIIDGSINADSEYFNNPNKDIYYHLLANSKQSIIGFPTGAYGWGVLITIFTHDDKIGLFGKCQIYIPHCYDGNIDRGSLYIRSFDDKLNENYAWRVFKPSECIFAKK